MNNLNKQALKAAHKYLLDLLPHPQAEFGGVECTSFNWEDIKAAIAVYQAALPQANEVERVARAIAQSALEQTSLILTIDECIGNKPFWKRYIPEAKAAIAALQQSQAQDLEAKNKRLEEQFTDLLDNYITVLANSVYNGDLSMALSCPKVKEWQALSQSQNNSEHIKYENIW